MNWKDIHEESIIFDWHNHGTLKKFLFDRSLNGKDSRFLTKLFKRAFWPLSERNTLPKMEEGGLDVVLSTSFIPEIEWVDDQSLIKFLKWIYPSVRKRVFDPTYFDATNAQGRVELTSPATSTNFGCISSQILSKPFIIKAVCDACVPEPTFMW